MKLSVKIEDERFCKKHFFRDVKIKTVREAVVDIDGSSIPLTSEGFTELQNKISNTLETILDGIGIRFHADRHSGEGRNLG